MDFFALCLGLALGLALGSLLGRRRSRAPGVQPSTSVANSEPGGPSSTAPVRLADHLALPPAILGRISHELRSPIAAISSALEVLEGIAPEVSSGLEPGPRDDSGESDVAARQREAGRRARSTARAALVQIEGISRSVGAIGRARPEQKSEVAAETLVEASLLLTGPDLRGLEIERNGACGTTLRVVPGQVVSVLANLLTNASRALGGQGRLRIEIRPIGPTVEFHVSDTGPGVPGEAAERIFAEGYSHWPGETRGDGYGLALGREIARSHGGDLVLGASALGGATFVLRLPRGAEAG